MKYVLCEDNQEFSNDVRSLIREWASLKDPYAEVFQYSSAEELISHRAVFADADGFFLDIFLPGMSGFDLALQVREWSNTVPIVFISNSGEYLRKGYEVNAYRYLIKPIFKDDLYQCLNYCLDRKKETEKRSILVKMQGESFFVDLEHVSHISAQGHSVLIHTKAKTFKSSIRTGFDAYIEAQHLSHFLRCHQSFLVNPRFISGYSNQFILLLDGTKVPISRSFRAGVIAKMHSLFLGAPV